MGIKGIYKEIGPGERISLCKLAVEHLEQTGRPFRLAIDISIWQFQVQAAKGGSNPATRTLFYRLVRLLGHAIQPIFIFDGPNKPAFKRNKRSGRGDGVATAMAKRLIRLFGFIIHDAPGEAEAECAYFQQQGIVDAVLSEDVDTIMFGCRRTLRNWAAEDKGKAAKTPTHVSMYQVGDGPDGRGNISGLDREGMVLVAMMSGGDYIPEGVPGCGVKLACEAARAGFGRDLCQIKRADKNALAAWRERLRHELRTNESGFFRTKHKALDIPETFPSIEVLRYYTHPVVSRQATVDRIGGQFPATAAVNVAELREFVRETFDWSFRIGAVKYIRVLAPSLLVQLLLARAASQETLQDQDLDLRQEDESKLVRTISSRRTHSSTDSTPELRIAFIPADIVGLNLDDEPEEEVEEFGRNGIALNSDDEFEEEAGGDEPGSSSQAKIGGKRPFDALQPDLAWLPESLVKLGTPLAIQDWEAKQRAKGSRNAAKTATTTTTTTTTTRQTRSKKSDMPVGALDKFVTVTKSTADNLSESAHLPLRPSSPPPSSLPLPLQTKNSNNSQLTRSSTQQKPTSKPATRNTRSTQLSNNLKPQISKPIGAINPWTLAGSQVSPKIIKSSTSSFSAPPQKSSSAHQPILIESSPAAAPAFLSPIRPSNSYITTASATTTPTRTTRAPKRRSTSPPGEENFPDSPSQPQQITMAPITRARARNPHQSPSPRSRKPRSVKRTRKSADTDVGSSTQRSIADYGRVRKDTTSAAAAVDAKIVSAGPITTIDLLSDSDDDDNHNKTGNVSLRGGEDGFASKHSSPHSSNSSPSSSLPPIHSDDEDPFTSAPALPFPSSAKSKAPQPTSYIHLNTNTTTVSKPPKTNSPAALASLKTKIFIPCYTSPGHGYFNEVDVSDDDDNHEAGFGAEHADVDDDAAMYASLSGMARAQKDHHRHHQLEQRTKRFWRGSEITIVDLTRGD
ncbi:hypothetical protein B0T19DRAFT_487179 [Cercophora scortea]|uniref:Flap structure-specific endonuclease n=1 Tax=Cercophora scortea TaxID=314031 RepID=A0AAE0I9A9_9PEZI|nr:hypothetical protein B0T19DRAFT_487179 [Cercophora scortea]